MAKSIFVDMVDELVRSSDDDPDLADGLKWIDEQALQRGISFYDMVFEVLYRCDATVKPRTWLEHRN